MFEQLIHQILEFLNTAAAQYSGEAIGAVIILLLLVAASRIRRRQHRQIREDIDRLDEELLSEEEIEAELEAAMETEETEEKIQPVISEPPSPGEIISPPEPAPPAAKSARKPAEAFKAPKETPTGFFNRLKSGMTKTRQNLSGRFDAIFAGSRKMDAEMLEEIEETLITADVGVPTTMELMDRISQKSSSIHNAEDFKRQLKSEMAEFLESSGPTGVPQGIKPYVILMVGVNGVGKTTTIGKLAARYHAEGKKVLLAASDTFRAAAVEQLEIWAKRSDADIVMHRDKADPAAVAFDGVEAAMARDVDVVIVDTAGRLHTKVNLMEQLKKIKRSISKKYPSAPHEILLVLDATTGQNALSQAKLFHEEIGVTGIILTKLDGTAKGGIVLSICHMLNIPIRYIGIGEQIDDLQKFDPKLFVDALL